jgi:hypothetical protein
MNVRPVSLLELTVAAALVTAVNLALLLWSVQQRGRADWSQWTESQSTQAAPPDSAPQGHAP